VLLGAPPSLEVIPPPVMDDVTSPGDSLVRRRWVVELLFGLPLRREKKRDEQRRARKKEKRNVESHRFDPMHGIDWIRSKMGRSDGL
jgi:hypothetical protein